MKNNYKNIAELVERVKEKDADAFVELYNNMYHQVYFLALSIVKDNHLAQDVVQETFINVYNSIHKLNKEITFIAWVDRITYNCALKMITKNAEIPLDNSLVENVFSSSGREEPLEMVISKEKSQAMMNLILELSPEYRTTLILKYYENMKIEEIASCMECSTGTVKSRLNRAKNALRKNILSRGKLLMLLAVGGFSMAFSIKSYAKESVMTSSMAEATLDAIKQKLGITSTLGCKTVLATAGITLRKKILAGASILLVIFGGGLWGEGEPTIEVAYPNDAYTNTAIEIMITVDSHIPVKSICVLLDGKEIPVVGTDRKGVYKLRAPNNGSFQTEVALWNGSKSTRDFEVTKIDRGTPKLCWYDWNTKNNTFYCLISDDLSGVDYTKTYQQGMDGKKYAPISWKEDTGEVQFQLLEVPFNIKIYDNVDNASTYKIESYMFEE